MTNHHRHLTNAALILMKIGVCGYLIAKPTGANITFLQQILFELEGAKFWGSQKTLFKKHLYLLQDIFKL